jgi:hypothetical protein
VDIRPGGREAAAEIGTDGAGPEHRDLHRP